MQELAFPSKGDLLEFVGPFGLTFADPDKTKLDCKASASALPL